MLNYKHFNTGYNKLCLECITIKFIRKWFISNLLQAIKFSGSLTSIANHFIDAINFCSFCKNSFLKHKHVCQFKWYRKHCIPDFSHLIKSYPSFGGCISRQNMFILVMLTQCCYPIHPTESMCLLWHCFMKFKLLNSLWTKSDSKW